MSDRDALNVIAATLGKPVWRHVHYSARYGGTCATKGCDCDRDDCHGVVCGMQQAIDKHATDVRRAVAEEHNATWQQLRDLLSEWEHGEYSATEVEPGIAYCARELRRRLFGGD